MLFIDLMFLVLVPTNQNLPARWVTLDTPPIVWEQGIEIGSQIIHQHLMATHFQVCARKRSCLHFKV